MAKKVAVIGLGTFGFEIACHLAKEGAEVLAIDRDPKLIQEIKDYVTSAAILDALDKKALEALGVPDMDSVVLGFRSHFDSSVLLTMLLKELEVDNVLVLAASEEQRKALEKIGADEIIFPEKDIAQKLARRLVVPSFIDEIVLSSHFGIIEVTAPASFIGKSLADLAIRRNYLVHVIAVKHLSKGAKEGEEPITVIPPSEYTFSKRDRLLVLGEKVHLQEFTKIE